MLAWLSPWCMEIDNKKSGGRQDGDSGTEGCFVGYILDVDHDGWKLSWYEVDGRQRQGKYAIRFSLL